MVCPSSRAVASIPPAAPERSRGAELKIVRLLGDWNKPKPIPHSAIRQAMSSVSGELPRRDSANKPAAKITSPTPPISPARARSARRPANGATTPSANRRESSAAPFRRLRPHHWNRNGSATNASVCAANDTIDVAIDMLNMRILRRSTGNKGALSPHSRCTNSAPAARPATMSDVRGRAGAGQCLNPEYDAAHHRHAQQRGKPVDPVALPAGVRICADSDRESQRRRRAG